jgi:hypothetical protein
MLRAMQEVIEQIMDSVKENPITDIKESRKCEGGDENHHRRPVHFLFARPRDALHLNLNFLVIVTEALPSSTLNAEFVRHNIKLVSWNPLPALAPKAARPINGRGGGIRTPTTGFGDRQSSR